MLSPGLGGAALDGGALLQRRTLSPRQAFAPLHTGSSRRASQGASPNGWCRRRRRGHGGCSCRPGRPGPAHSRGVCNPRASRQTLHLTRPGLRGARPVARPPVHHSTACWFGPAPRLVSWPVGPSSNTWIDEHSHGAPACQLQQCSHLLAAAGWPARTSDAAGLLPPRLCLRVTPWGGRLQSRESSNVLPYIGPP